MITRANTENLSDSPFWCVYQTTVRIADISTYGFSEQRVLGFCGDVCGRVPKIVPIVFGINLNWRFVGASRKAVVSAITILASASVPKYATSMLFLREMAHIL